MSVPDSGPRTLCCLFDERYPTQRTDDWFSSSIIAHAVLRCKQWLRLVLRRLGIRANTRSGKEYLARTDETHHDILLVLNRVSVENGDRTVDRDAKQRCNQGRQEPRSDRNQCALNRDRFVPSKPYRSGSAEALQGTQQSPCVCYRLATKHERTSDRSIQ
ncbi:hypothetical protein SV7mr_23410 [Stieleria bergensis]|uniref:Uncharacterized protein n=1 Tax=Stieleria bergensis TaxID=2528025 RepID=A0A517SUM5_9BACT|nr:hypothetical protein SV7mr_23410 [Planctomycetes bacterium SV_7m_r]